MIRMLHFADIHIGMENYGRPDPESGLSTRVIDFLRRLDEMIAYAADHNVDVAVFAGDAFKNRQPNPTLQREFAHRIRDLATLCPVVMLVGNHDLPTNAVRASSIEIYDTLGVPNVLVAQSYELHWIDTKSGPLQVAAAPYPIRSQLFSADEIQGMTIAQIDGKLQDKLQLLLRDLSQRAAQSDVPRVLTGHFTLTGAITGSERNVMVGRDVALLLSEVADPVWDYVAMGHVHKHQNLTQGRSGVPPVVYSGSMERIDFGEEADRKGFCWVELERGNTTWRFVEVGARPFVTLDIDVRGQFDPTANVLDMIAEHHLENAIVRVRIQADELSAQQLNDGVIRERLHQAGVDYIAAIKKDVEHPARSRLGGNLDQLTEPLDLLEHYLQAKAMPRDQIDALLERADALFQPNHTG